MPRHSLPDGPVTPSTSPVAVVTVRSDAEAGDPNTLSDAKIATAASKKTRVLDRTESLSPVPPLHHNCFMDPPRVIGEPADTALNGGLCPASSARRQAGDRSGEPTPDVVVRIAADKPTATATGSGARPTARLRRDTPAACPG